MKASRLVILWLLTLSSIGLYAQITDKSSTSFGLIAGVNFQNLTGEDAEGRNLENEMIIGFHGGVNIQFPVAPEFFFQPGILFTTKGAKHTSDLVTSTYNFSYLEVPLNLVYKGYLGNGFVFLGLGPYIAYGIGGKATHKTDLGTLESDIEFMNVVEMDDPLTVTYIKTLDAGGNIFAGYEIASGISLQLNAQLGMIKINPEDKRITDDRTSLKNTGFGLSLGYRF